MKRLLCLLLTAVMLFSAAACTVDRTPPQTETPSDALSDPAAAPETEEAPDSQTPSAAGDPEEPADPEEPVILEEPEIQPLDDPFHPPIDLTDPIPPIYVTEGRQDPVNGYADFSNLLSASILSGTQNRNLSPISVYLALAMAAEGARGDTQAELLKLLGCKDVAELRTVCGGMLKALSCDGETGTLELCNSLWTAKKIQFHEDYLKTLADTYRSEANAVEFGTLSAAKQIADWIREKTHGKIDVRPDDFGFDGLTVAVLINSIYLKDNWATTFAPENTESGTFDGLNGEMTVDYMRRFDENGVIRQGDGWIAYRVYLSEVGYVTFVLPDEGVALDSLLGSPEAIDRLLHAGISKSCDVSLMIPKFRFQDKMELADVLKALGVKLAFSDYADFSGISDVDSYISRVLQESYIGVDENGVEAAAYTMVTIKTKSFNPVELEKIDFHLTRPFFYAIESYDGTVMFIGTVTEPTASTPVGK